MNTIVINILFNPCGHGDELPLELLTKFFLYWVSLINQHVVAECFKFEVMIWPNYRIE